MRINEVQEQSLMDHQKLAMIPVEVLAEMFEGGFQLANHYIVLPSVWKLDTLI